MKINRKQRYFQKIAELDDKVDFIGENIGDKGKFPKDRILRKVIYKEFQELIDIINTKYESNYSL